MKLLSILLPMNRRSEGRLSSRPTSAPEKAPLQGSASPGAVWGPWRLSFGLFLLASLLCCPRFPRAVAAPAGLPDTSKMNLLFIIMEDCYAGVWGSYGNPICKTPNMDRFARTAVQFDSASSYMELKNGPVPAALYDLENDAWETTNLADDPAHAKTRAEMAALLQAGWKAALPPVAKN